MVVFSGLLGLRKKTCVHVSVTVSVCSGDMHVSLHSVNMYTHMCTCRDLLCVRVRVWREVVSRTVKQATGAFPITKYIIL